MSDAEMMRRAIELAASVRGTTAPNPWVGAVLPDAPVATCSRARPRPGAAPTPRRSAAMPPRGPAPTPGGRRWPPPSSPAATRAARRRASTPSWPLASARVVVGIEDPDPVGPARALERLQAGSRGARRRAAPRSRPGLRRPTCTTADRRPGGAEAGGHASTGALAAADGTSRGSPARRPAPTPTGLRAARRRPGRGAARCGRDDPSLTVRHVEGQRPARVVSARRRRRSRAPLPRAVGRPADVLDDWVGAGSCSCWSRRRRTAAGAFHARAWSIATSCYLAPALVGWRRRCALLAGPARRPSTTLWRGRICRRRAASGPDLRIVLRTPGAGA